MGCELQEHTSAVPRARTPSGQPADAGATAVMGPDRSAAAVHPITPEPGVLGPRRWATQKRVLREFGQVAGWGGTERFV